MKVLIVCSGNSNQISPFISDQVKSLNKMGINTDYFLIKGKGFWGYLKTLPSLKNRIKEIKPDLIHAHYGLSGLLSSLQRKVPVITTFHGSDINIKKNLIFSKLAYNLSRDSVFVSQDMANKISKKNTIVIPCGVDLNIFQPCNKEECKELLQLELNKKYILFSSSFNNKIKNYELAKEAVANLENPKIELLELKGFRRNEVALLLNAVDLALMTSFSEGSPQFIKEAMACNIPIVATDVGDVRKVFESTKGCYITSFEPEDVAKKIQKAIVFGKRTNGRERLKELCLDSETVSKKIIQIYKEVI